MLIALSFLLLFKLFSLFYVILILLHYLSEINRMNNKYLFVEKSKVEIIRFNLYHKNQYKTMPVPLV
jgi:hypothetical protein